jgi:hypothetical protein
MFPGSSKYTFKPPLGSVVNTNHPLSQGLVGFWLFNEQTGNKIYDLNKDNHGNLLNGPIWNSTNNGYLQFDGTNDSVDFGDNLDIGLSNYTFCISFKASSLSGLLHGLFSKAIAADATQRYALFIYNTGGNYKITTFISNGGSSDVQTPSTINVVTNVWYHVAVVFNRSDKVYLYINGNLDSSATISQFQAIDFQSSYNFRLASYGDAANNASYFLNGIISNFQVYNRALTAEEIKSLYENPYQFVNPYVSLKNYSYRQQGVLYIPSISSAESMGSAILPGPVTLGVSSIASQESFSNSSISDSSYDQGTVLKELYFNSSLQVTDLNEIKAPIIQTATQFGTTGSTQYSYKVTAFNKYGETLASLPITISNGNSTLNSTNYIRITWNRSLRAEGYKIYGRKLNEETFIATVNNVYYDDIGLATSYLPPVKNTSGYDYKKLSVAEDLRLYTGDYWKENFISANTIYRNPFGDLAFYPTNPFQVVDWTENITWIFADEWRNWTSCRIHLLSYDKREDRTKYIGSTYLAFPNGSQNFQPYDLEVLYEKYNTGTVTNTGTSVTGTSTAWVDFKFCNGARIGFGSTDPEFVLEWIEVSTFNSNTSITLVDTPSINYPANTPYVIEEIRIIVARFNNSGTLTNGGIFMAKGLSLFDFWNEKSTSIPTATTVDRVKACYFLSTTVNHSYYYPNCVLGPKIDNNTQYLYVLSAQNNISTNNHFLVYNVRADLVSSGGITSSAFVTRSNVFTTQIYSTPAAVPNKLTIATTLSGPGKGKECLYFNFYWRTYRFLTADLRIPNANIIFDEYMINNRIGGFQVGTNSHVSPRYLPEEDLFYSKDYSYNAHFFYKPSSSITQMEVGRFFLTPHHFSYYVNDDFDVEFTRNYSQGTFYSRLSNGNIILMSDNIGQWAAFNLVSYRADIYFAEKYNNFIVTPAISTYNCRKLKKLFLKTNVSIGNDISPNLSDDAIVYVRTSGIEDNSGKWIVLNKYKDLSKISPSDKIQFRFGFKTLASTHVPIRIYNLGVLYETFDNNSDEFQWNLEDTSYSSSIVGFSFKSIFNKDYILINNDQVFVIECRDVNNNLVYKQKNFETEFGVFQYFNGTTWVNGTSFTLGSRNRFIQTYSIPNNPKVYFKLYTSTYELLKIEKYSELDTSENQISLSYSNTARSSETDNPLTFNGINSYITANKSILNNLFPKGFSISVALFLNENSSNNIMSIISKSNGNTGNNFFNLYIDADKKINFWIGNSSILSSVGSIISGYLYHIVVTWNGSVAYLYINNRLNNSSSIGGSLSKFDLSYQIGSFNNTNFFSGKLYDLQVFETYLSALEVGNINKHLKLNLKSKFYGKVRKTLPSSIYYTEGTISFNSSLSTIRIPGLKETKYLEWHSDRFDNYRFAEVVKNHDYIEEFNYQYSDSGYRDTIDYYGSFYAPESGSYTFSLLDNNRGYIWIGSLADSGFNASNYHLYSNGSTATYTTTLTANTYYPIRLLHSNSDSGFRIIFSVSGPNIPNTTLMSNYLSFQSSNRRTLTGTGTNFRTINTGYVRLFIGDKNIYNDSEVIELDKPSDATTIALNTFPTKNYTNNIQYAILKNVSIYLDASEKKSYPGTGRIWYDLSGNNNHFTMTQNDCIWNAEGYFTGFSKQSFFIPLNAKNIMRTYPFFSNEVNVFIVIKNTSQHYTLLHGPVFYGVGSPGNQFTGYELAHSPDSKFFYTSDFSQQIYDQRTQFEDYPLRECVLSFQYLNNNSGIINNAREKYKLYVNGIKRDSNYRQNSSTRVRYGGFSIGNYPHTFNNALDTRIYAVMVINREMTDAEVLEMSNYFIDKFNLDV